MEAYFPFSRLRPLLIRLCAPATAACVLAGITACDVPREVPKAPNAQKISKAREINEPSGAPRLSVKQIKQMNVLHKIYAADPEFRAIESAAIDEENEISVVLNPELALDEVPRVMAEVLTEMAKEFPGQNLTAVAYIPEQPPRRVAVARLDSDTGEISFEWDLSDEEEQPRDSGSSQMFI